MYLKTQKIVTPTLVWCYICKYDAYPHVSRLIFDPFLTLKTYLEIKTKFLHAVFCALMILQDTTYHTYPAYGTKIAVHWKKCLKSQIFTIFRTPRLVERRYLGNETWYICVIYVFWEFFEPPFICNITYGDLTCNFQSPGGPNDPPPLPLSVMKITLLTLGLSTIL